MIVNFNDAFNSSPGSISVNGFGDHRDEPKPVRSPSLQPNSVPSPAMSFVDRLHGGTKHTSWYIATPMDFLALKFRSLKSILHSASAPCILSKITSISPSF
jgi:hypothetical protein